MLNDRQVIEQVVMRRQALAALEAAEALDLLEFVDRARAEGESAGGLVQGRRRVDAAVHELSLAMTLPVPTVERRVARARRLRSTMPQVWRAWMDVPHLTRGCNMLAPIFPLLLIVHRWLTWPL